MKNAFFGFALICAMGCGDDDGGTDAGMDAGADGGTDSGVDAPMLDTSVDAMMVDLLEDSVRASAAVSEALCECTFEEEAHASVAECIAFDADDIDTACFRAAFDAVVAAGLQAQGEAFLRCDTAARDELITCYASAGCDEAATQACRDAFGTRADMCPVSMELGEAFSTGTTDCYQAMLVGDPSGCPDTDATTSDVGAAVFSGSTVLQGNDMEPSSGALGSCAGMGGADVQHQWTAPSTGSFVIDTIGSNFDTVLYVLDGCEGSYLGCNDDVRPELGARSRLTLDATADTEYLIVVDGYDDSSGGNYVVNITAE